MSRPEAASRDLLLVGATRMQLEVLVWRGEIPESRHRFQAAVSDAAGRLHAATERADAVTTFRSAAKPFQLLPLVERGHAERWRFDDEQIAVMAASHTGNPRHLELVSGILARLGLGDQHLACGFHEPLDAESLARLRADPALSSPLYNNCSGKHAGMLCLSLSEGWPVAGYHLPAHPVQQLMRKTVAEMCGLEPEALAVAVDGCNVSVFGAPLAAMARAYARLASATSAGEQRERALARIRGAMTAHPAAVEGAGRFSTVLMQRTRGGLVAKGGAEGLACVGIPARGLGVAIKCEDGSARGLPAATLAVLEHLEALDRDAIAQLGEYRRPILKNPAGTEVGELEAMIRVLAPASQAAPADLRPPA